MNFSLKKTKSILFAIICCSCFTVKASCFEDPWIYSFYEDDDEVVIRQTDIFTPEEREETRVAERAEKEAQENETLAQKGHAYRLLKAGDYEKAIVNYRELLKTHHVRGERIVFLKNCAYACFRMGQFDLSFAYYGELLNTIPEKHAVFLVLLDGIRKKGNFSKETVSAACSQYFFTDNF